MTNALQRLKKILNPQYTEHIGTITSVDHPNYKVLVSDGSGLVMCTSNTAYNLGAKVFISNHEIKRPAPTGEVINIEV